MSKRNHAAMDAGTSTSGESDKQQWVVIYYNDEDPDEQFEIVELSRVTAKSQAILKPLIYVSVRYGNAKLLGSLVDIFDDHDYVKENFEKIKEKFLKDHPGGVKPHHAFRPIPVKRVKMTEKEIQTDPEKISDLETEIETITRLYKKEQELNMMRHNIVLLSKLNAIALSTRCRPSTGTNDESSSEEDTDEDSDTDKDNNQDQMVTIGSNNTKIPRAIYKTIPWNSYTAAVRKLLMTLFDRNTLATHTLTGKPSPAFVNAKKPAKLRLHPLIVSDIVELVTQKCGVSQSLVRGAITSKCADENKMMRKRMQVKKEREDDDLATDDGKEDATEEAGCSSTQE